MFKLDRGLSFKLVKLGWILLPIYKGNALIIVNPDDEEEKYTFKTNNQIIWFLRGFESGLVKTEEIKREDIIEPREVEVSDDV